MLMRRAIFMCAGALIVLVVAAVAGWWFFVREDDKLATNAPDIPADLVQPTESAPTASAGNDVLRFRIVPEQSEAAYFVDEELAFSIGVPSTAKGVTQEIEGEFHLTSDGTALAPDAGSSFTVDLRNLTSDKSRRDERVQEALETATYPTATFAITGVTGYDPSIAEGEEQTLMLTGTLDLHGVQKDVAWQIQAKRESNVISALATLVVPFADFNITAPTFAGLVSIEDKATLQVQLVAELV